MKAKHILIFLLGCWLQTTVLAQENTHEYTVAKDVVWASPDGMDLTMDIYTPDTGKKSYPVLIIFHGGGWLINNKSIMGQMSEYVAEHGEYVVCNVNYRLLVDNDNTVTMNQIVEDAFGAVLWVKDHIKTYNGNPKKVAVTGDSAGGHLAEMVVIMGDQLSSSGFSERPLGFNPTYLPEGKTAEDIARENGLRVQAAIISYGAVDIYGSAKNGFEKPSNFFWQMGGAKPRPIFGENYNVDDNPEFYKAVSPLYNIPKNGEKKLPPQFFTVGSKDNLITPAMVKDYTDKLKAAGYPTEYWVYEGRPHAFMDSGSNEYLGINFEKDAIEPLKKILSFLDQTLK